MSLLTIIRSTERPSGGGPVMGTGPRGDQLPCAQRSVNSSAQTNSQSSGVAGQAGEHVCAHLCVERMKKKRCVCVWGGRALLSLQQARSKGLRDYSAREADLTASLESFSSHFCHLSLTSWSFQSSNKTVTRQAMRCMWGLWRTGMCTTTVVTLSA